MNKIKIFFIFLLILWFLWDLYGFIEIWVGGYDAAFAIYVTFIPLILIPAIVLSILSVSLRKTAVVSWQKILGGAGIWIALITVTINIVTFTVQYYN